MEKESDRSITNSLNEKKPNYIFGLNSLNQLFYMAFNELTCDRMDCLSYNVNLNFVSKLFDKFTTLSEVNIYSNTEKIVCSGLRKDIYQLISEQKIQFHHISENSTIIHSKLYFFQRDEKLIFAAIGSPNLTNHSNQNFESLICIYDPSVISKIWNKTCEIFELYEIESKSTVPSHILKSNKPTSNINEKYLEGLWEHQKSILSWMIDRNNSIVNIPTGCGKTKIALQYLKYLNEIDDDITAIVLVPKKILIEQWLDILSKEGIEGHEFESDVMSVGEYFASPEKKVLVTLYSRFNKHYLKILSKLNIIKPNILLIGDECHNFYGNLSALSNFIGKANANGMKSYNVGLSATIDTFNVKNMDRYIEIMGGESNRYEISLQSFYSFWNTVNSLPSLKPIKYIPIKYCLSKDEMDDYEELTKKVGMQSHMTSINGSSDFSAAIKRAMWVRNLDGGVNVLKNFIQKNIKTFGEHNTLIFVQTSAIAEKIRNYLTSTYGWNEYSSAYVYDSKHNANHLNYALQKFKQNNGFCLVSVFMLSEGFDIPKITRVILHGSRKSNRDWLQKIGRAIRYDSTNPNSVAEIVDVVFCSPNGEPLNIEKERYEILNAISI